MFTYFSNSCLHIRLYLLYSYLVSTFWALFAKNTQFKKKSPLNNNASFGIEHTECVTMLIIVSNLLLDRMITCIPFLFS